MNFRTCSSDRTNVSGFVLERTAMPLIVRLRTCRCARSTGHHPERVDFNVSDRRRSLRRCVFRVAGGVLGTLTGVGVVA